MRHFTFLPVRLQGARPRRVLGGVFVALGVLCHPVAAASESPSDTGLLLCQQEEQDCLHADTVGESPSDTGLLPGPANLVVEARGRSIRVSWEAVAGAERYQVTWRHTDATSWASFTADLTAVTIPNLSTGSYLVAVGACQGEPPTCTPQKHQTKQRVKVRDKTLAQLTRTFVGSATSVEEFVAGLPEPHKHRATFMVDSQGLDQDFVSERRPRVISFGATADTIFAWGTNANSPRYEEVEFIAKEAGDWAFGVIDFTTSPPTVERDETCQSCHVGDPPHPLWAQYPGWPGSVTTKHEARATKRVEAWHETGDPRRTAIPVWPDDFYHDRMAHEFTSALAMRHGEVLIESVLPDEPAAGVQLAQDLLCRGDNDWKLNIQARFPAKQMPSTMGDGRGGHRNVDSHESLQEDYRTAYNASVSSVIALYLVHYLVAHEERVETMYEAVDNIQSARFSWHLHHAPGTASALDELESRVKIAFGLKGNKQLRYRRNIQADISRDMLRDMRLGADHLKFMVPKVCKALDAG